MQAPEHTIENARRVAKAAGDEKKLKRVQKVKPADGVVSWTEETFTRLRTATPEALVSRMRVNHAMLLNLINQRRDPAVTLRELLEDNHEDERGRRRLAEQAASLQEELLVSGVLERLDAARRVRPHAPARARAAAGLRARTSRWPRSRRPRST